MGICPKYGRVQTERGSILDNEPVFLFRAQDLLAPIVLAFYAYLVEASQSELDPSEVMYQAVTMATWRIKKLPD